MRARPAAGRVVEFGRGELTRRDRDAAACENAFVPALKKLGDGAKVTFHYIGSGKDGNFNCMHGPAECAGDIQQLCVQAHGSRDQLLDFVVCQDNSQMDIPGNGQTCATRAGLDWSAIDACVKGAEGSDLMTASLASSTEKGIGCEAGAALVPSDPPPPG